MIVIVILGIALVLYSILGGTVSQDTIDPAQSAYIPPPEEIVVALSPASVEPTPVAPVYQSPDSISQDFAEGTIMQYEELRN